MVHKILTFDEIMKYHKQLNSDVFNEIKRDIGQLTPFVGAGLSAFVYPLWKSALEKLTVYIADTKSKTEVKALIKDNRLEDAAQKIEDVLGENGLERNLITIFSNDKLDQKKDELYKQAVYLLPYLFKHNVITTNYDTIIETVYHSHNLPFNTVLLPGRTSLFNQSLTQGNDKHVIYKGHGEINDNMIDAESLVFTKRSYDVKYLPSSALVKELKKIYNGNKMLFLGCSLSNDRTLDILKKIIEPGQVHYAIIPCKKKKLDERIRELSDKYNIRVIVYPEGYHEAVRIILEILLKEIDEDSYKSLGYSLTAIKESSANKFLYDADIFPFVGRKNELKELRAFCDCEKSNHFKWWAITGAGGAGKSRLAYDFSKELKTKNWYVKNLNHSDYDRLEEISNNCKGKTLFIADYVQGHLEKIGKWLCTLVDKPLIRVLLIERDNKKIDYSSKIEGNNAPWCELMYFFLNDYRTIENHCYKEKFLDLHLLSDNDLIEIMANYAKEFGKNLSENDEKLLLGALENVDKDLKRPLYAQFIVDAWLKNKNPIKWDRKKILNYIVTREKLYDDNRVRNLLYNGPNKKLSVIVNKIKVIATIYENIEIKELKNSHPKVWNELEKLVDKMDLVSSPKEFLDKIGFLEDESVKALRPDLLGEYFVYDFIINNNNYEILFVKDWHNEVRILRFLIRYIVDYGDLISNNNEFVTHCLSYQKNDLVYPSILSMLIFILSIYNNDVNVLKKFTEELNKLNKKYPENEEIALALAKALVNLSFKQDIEGIKESIEEIGELNKKYPENERITLRLAKALVNLSFKQDIEGIKESIEEIRELNKKYPENEEIVLELAKALVNLSCEQNIEGIKESIEEIRELNKKYPENEKIALALAKALFNLSCEQDIEGIKESIEEIRELNKKYPENEEIASALAEALFNLSCEQDIEGRKESIEEIRELNEKYPENEEMALLLAKALFNLSNKQDIEGIKESIEEIRELNKKYPENEEIALALAKVLMLE